MTMIRSLDTFATMDAEATEMLRPSPPTIVSCGMATDMRLESVDQEIIGKRGEAEDRLLHGGKRRLQDIHGINDRRLNDADTDRNRIPLDHFVETLPLSGESFFESLISGCS